MQRRNSNGSSVSGTDSPRPDTLQRRGSSGSMTERSFRSQSPSRASPAVSVAPDVPPVPAFPDDLSQLDRTPSGHRRASSVEPPGRIYSPPPSRQGGRGVSLDRTPQSPTKSPEATRVSRLTKVPELEREGSQRSSVNFSRPMSSQSGPAPQAGLPKSSGWFTAPVASDQKPRQTLDPIKPSSSHGPPGAVLGAPRTAQPVTTGPLKAKKKKRAASHSEGSFLASGTTKLTGTALQHMRGSSDASTDQKATRLNNTHSREGAYIGDGSLRGSGDSSSESSPPVVKQRPQSWNSRSGALLSKQPSVVHERPEFEEQSEQATSANTGRKVDTAPAKPSLESSRYAPSMVPSQSTSAEQTSYVQSTGSDAGHANGKPEETERPGRLLSPSPVRIAHFSDVPVELSNGVKHSPSGRSNSPFKSALKHSPSSSLRTTSPEARFVSGHSRTVSESLEEGQKPKKTARVSFDDAPVVVPAQESSNNADLAMTRRLSDDDLEEIMKPRPTLPSFGSVRGRKDVEETRNLPRSSRGSRSPTSPSRSLVVGPSSSNDHVVGGILAQDFAARQRAESSSSSLDLTIRATHPGAPLPPEVTTVEGSGYVSDTDSTFSTDARQHEPSEVTDPSSVLTAPGTEKISHPVTVPSFTLIPPTPAAEEERTFSIPGAFPSFESDNVSVNEDKAPASPELAQAQVESSPTTSTTRDTDGSTPPIYNLSHLPVPTAGEDSSDSDTSSVYSDAAEDPSELYGGFASLDAIVDSPIAESKKPFELPIPPKSQSTVDQNDSPPSPTAAHWDKTTEYWHGLSERKRRELEQHAVDTGKPPTNDLVDDEEEINPIPEQISTFTPPAPEPTPKPRKLRVQPAISTSTSQPSAKPRQFALKHTLRTSMDTDESESTHMRTTLRNGGAIGPTMRGQKNGLAASRWSSPPPDREPKGTLQKKRISATSSPPRADITLAPASAKPTPSPMPILRRQGSGDSVSSFKRQRSRPANPDGKISLRKSMRDASPQTYPQSLDLQSSRYSVRSLSPAGSTVNYHMRSSLRQSMDSNVPTLRSQDTKQQKKSRFKSPTRFGLSKSSQPKPAAISSPSKFKSRFADDSDDDDEPRPAFVSRFQDSDDELESPYVTPIDLTPVRGIPRRTGADEDSTDLEDESTDELPAVPAIPSAKDIEQAHNPTSRTNGNTQGKALTYGSLRDGSEGLAASKHAPRPELKKNRLSFLGMGKKRSSSVPAVSTQSPTQRASFNSGRKPKLQRKNTPTMLAQVPEDSWPLSGPPKNSRGAEDDRPSTSEGVSSGPPTVQRPDVGKRRSTSDGVSSFTRKVSFIDAGEPVYSQKTGLKKKFPRLRRMFGLND
jgi:serine/arginine repetitive matrix protein 2